jgi:sulfatase maturation enzyme AslB (radical SAM superfamily)
MRIKQNVCSKMWTDTNVNFRLNSIRHCCKQLEVPISLQEIKEYDIDIFEHYPVLRTDKRTMLINNEIPETCKLCKINDKQSIRHSWNKWSDDYINHNRQSMMVDDMAEYIELDLGNQCDLACVYCGPWASSTWAKEMGQPNKPISEYDQEWRDRMLVLVTKRIEQMAKDGKKNFSVNFLGGEPTLMPETYKILDNIIPVLKKYDCKPNLMFTTNLNTKEKLFDRFIDIIKETNDFAHWSIGVSVENVGKRAELVRYGLDFERMTRNLRTLAPHAKIWFTCTHNTMNLPYFDQALDYFFDVLDPGLYMTEDVGKGWGITPNCVYDNVLDPAYLDQHHVNWDQLYETMQRHNVTQKLTEHIQNIQQRVGTKKRGDKFYIYYRNLFLRTPEYAEHFDYIIQMLKDLESTVSPYLLEPDRFDVPWKTMTNMSDLVLNEDKQ